VFTQPLDTPCPSVTTLFACDREDVPSRMVVIGAGLSTAWVVRTFPKTEFIVLKRAEDNPVYTNLTGKWYENPNVRFMTLEESKTKLSRSDEDNLVMVQGISQPLPIYSATGSRYAPTPDYGFTGKKVLGTCIEREGLDAHHLFAGTGVIPAGSFSHSLCVYMQKTNNPHKEITGITYHHFCDNIIDTCVARGLIIDEAKKQEFFERYKARSAQHDHAPTTQQELDALLCESFNDIEADETQRSAFQRISSDIVEEYIDACQHPDDAPGFRV
jgi:hypothetical protein